MSCSDEPFGSALGVIEDEGSGVMFRKRARDDNDGSQPLTIFFELGSHSATALLK